LPERVDPHPIKPPYIIAEQPESLESPLCRRVDPDVQLFNATIKPITSVIATTMIAPTAKTPHTGVAVCAIMTPQPASPPASRIMVAPMSVLR
jgi:hypothetical protein